MMPRKVIALFVKEPVPGLVKTRLAADLGAHEACAVYRQLADRAIQQVAASGIPLVVFYHGRREGLPDGWQQKARSLMPQTGCDLGQRMAAAFCTLFRENVEHAVLIGSDIPGIDAAYLQQAFSLFDSHDIVIGPATDGGYCLIGFRQGSFAPALFEGVRWSTGQVLRQTLEAAERQTLKVGLLPALSDIDTVNDLRRVAAEPGNASWLNTG